MTSNKGQFRYTVTETIGTVDRGASIETIDYGTIDDPFIRTRIRPRGLAAAIAVLFGRLELEVRVDGSMEAYRVVFGGDYTPRKRDGIDAIVDAARAGIERENAR